MAYIGKEPIVGNFQKCDAITVVNGQAAYTLQVSSTYVVPESANHMLVSLNGILQAPVTSFTVSGSTLTFASNLATGDVIDFVILLGNVLDIGIPSDDSVTLAKMASGTDGNIISYDASGNPVAIATGNDGQVLTSAGAGQPPAFEAAAGGDNKPAFLGYHDASQTCSSNTWTKMQMDTAYFDTDGTFDHSTNYRWTPAATGNYFMFAHCRGYPGGIVDWWQSAIYKNGSEVSAGKLSFKREFVNSEVIASEWNTTNFSTIVNVTSTSDYFEFFFYPRGDNWTVQGIQFGGFKIIT